MLSSTNVVPSGTLSFTFTVVGAVPVLLFRVIRYVIVSPTITCSFPVDVKASFLIETCGFLTVSVTVSVGILFTVAVFVISFCNVSPSSSFTVTSKLKTVLPSAGTFSVIPSFKSFAVYSVFSLFTFMLPVTNDVPSGMLSIIVALPAKNPLLFTVIV